MRIRTSYPYDHAHEDVRIPLADGTRLYARVWRPLTDAPVPALLEYACDRLTDATAARDAQRHPWYAGHGYASVRVDARGHGNSEGVPAAAGTETGAAAVAADGAEVVGWLAARSWCDGNVGMFGIGRGGSVCLRVAALAPQPLKAVVAVCAVEDAHGDRYGDDRHRIGGSVSAPALHARSAAPLALACRPPDPRYAGDSWRDLWTARLASLRPPALAWQAATHRPADDAPGEAPAETDERSGRPVRPGAGQAAVFAVGGWYEPGRDTVLRLVEALPADRVRGLIGPWSRQYPDQDLPPGPAIGFLQETLRWWDHWLRGRDTAIMGEPLLRAHIADAHPPAAVPTALSGRWTGEPAWPSPHVTPLTYVLQGTPLLVRSPMHTGIDAGSLTPSLDDAGMPPDQREEDGRSACFEFRVAEETWLLGRPRARLRLTSPVPRGQVVARLCDVAPDGTSTLVTRGALSLTARHGRDKAVPWAPGTTEEVTVELDAVGHAFPAGHHIRLAVSSAYWPWLWPEPESMSGFVLDPADSTLELPVRSPTPDGWIAFAEPEQAEPLGVNHPAMLDEPHSGRTVVRDVAAGEWRLETGPRYGGTRVFPDGLEVTEEVLESYAVTEQDPLSARALARWSIRLHRPEQAWDAWVRTRSEVTCDADHFSSCDEVVCEVVHAEEREVVFHQTWEERIPRKGWNS
ncbi:CocE/NonD family hydrolase [Streptomyces sp. NK08204]|uniref:CocE/NonD family hydrolase n=1 Tax=Streptomyces sp. NK08204 TaxID=2873260 RepID=UPI001CED652B|nr:CocE/NonD family hydrolase [Streptomyces sp. NK08204]